VAQYLHLRVSTGRQAASDGKRHLFGRDRIPRILHALIEGAKNQALKERWSVWSFMLGRHHQVRLNKV
jgi:hypothetical protein